MYNLPEGKHRPGSLITVPLAWPPRWLERSTLSAVYEWGTAGARRPAPTSLQMPGGCLFLQPENTLRRQHLEQAQESGTTEAQGQATQAGGEAKGCPRSLYHRAEPRPRHRRARAACAHHSGPSPGGAEKAPDSPEASSGAGAAAGSWACPGAAPALSPGTEKSASAGALGAAGQRVRAIQPVARGEP